MKVVVAIDSFKGSASSNELANAISKGILKVYKNAQIDICPIADGGEGTVEALGFSDGAVMRSLTCKDPLGQNVEARYVILEDNIAVIEMASASGLPLVPVGKRNPSIASTHGTGELIVDAVNQGCREFIIGLGGSASNDAGLGMLRALGYRFYSNSDNEVVHAKELSTIVKIDDREVIKALKECSFQVACDVNNPLCGKNGASYVYAKQKGADEKMVEMLDKELSSFAKIVQKYIGKDFSKVKGSGAAGGLGFGFISFLNAKLKSGIEIVLEKVQFQDRISDADFVITGEGKIDKQSAMGKVIDGIAKVCKEQQVTCIALGGSVKEASEDVHEKGVTAYFSVMDSPMSLEEAMETKKTLKLVQKQIEQIFRLI